MKPYLLPLGLSLPKISRSIRRVGPPSAPPRPPSPTARQHSPHPHARGPFSTPVRCPLSSPRVASSVPLLPAEARPAFAVGVGRAPCLPSPSSGTRALRHVFLYDTATDWSPPMICAIFSSTAQPWREGGYELGRYEKNGGRARLIPLSLGGFSSSCVLLEGFHDSSGMEGIVPVF
jgi:hypothetical protein